MKRSAFNFPNDLINVSIPYFLVITTVSIAEQEQNYSISLQIIKRMLLNQMPAVNVEICVAEFQIGQSPERVTVRLPMPIVVQPALWKQQVEFTAYSL